jgi:hypothetical protein
VPEKQVMQHALQVRAAADAAACSSKVMNHAHTALACFCVDADGICMHSAGLLWFWLSTCKRMLLRADCHAMLRWTHCLNRNPDSRHFAPMPCYAALPTFLFL